MAEIEPGIFSFAPGRICLFGEHQDYLKFPVIAASIDLGIYIEFKGFHEPDDTQIIIEMPDINENRIIDINIPITYEGKRDYIASSINVLARDGIVATKGFTVCITGTLPINAGASSSSALVVAWLNLLGHLFSIEPVDPFQRAKWANQAEVGEFGEAGGFMDHVASSVGGILFVRYDFTIEKLPVPNDMFIVLADSEQKKQTVDDLKRLRANVERQIARIMKVRIGFSITDDKFCNEKFVADNAKTGLKLQQDFPLVYANLQNGIITKKALAAFKSKKPSIKIIGNLVNQHFGYLRDYLHVSTERIDAMVNAALETGAVGAKINGSGFGGTMFALCNTKETQNAVTEAIADVGGKIFNTGISDEAKIVEKNKITLELH